MTGVGVGCGDLMASVSEGRSSLVDVEGFMDISQEPLILLHQDHSPSLDNTKILVKEDQW